MTVAPRITAAQSVFLDAMRLSAAMVVFACHCSQFWFPSGREFLGPCSHSAVIVFFVLSGYVVALSTANRHRSSFRDYMSARLSRLYSIVLPALGLTLVLSVIGRIENPDFYSTLERSHWQVRYLIAAVFCQNIWMFSAAPASNVPLWSLSYEFFYYLIYGCFVFTTKGRARWALVALVMLVAGPDILLLFPCWLLGTVLYVKREALRRWVAHPGWTLAAGALLLAFKMAWLPYFPFDLSTVLLKWSGSFIGDWLCAIAFGLMIAGFFGLRLEEPSRSAVQRMRRAGDLTFPIYLFHYPLIVFLTAVFHVDQWALEGRLIACAFVVAVVVALGSLAERLRPRWRLLFDRVLRSPAPAAVSGG